MKDTAKLSMTVNDFRKVALLANAASSDKGRSALNGIKFEAEASTNESTPTILEAVATDNFILAKRTVEIEGDSVDALVPAKALAEFDKAIGGKKALDWQPVEMVFEDESLTIESHGVAHTVHLIDDTFPRWRRYFGDWLDRGESVKVEKIAFNPFKLEQLRKAASDKTKGQFKYPMILEFRGEDKPVKVTIGGDPGWAGLLMPARI